MSPWIIPLAAVVIGLSGPVLAQAQSEPPPVRITITKTDCSRLVRHVPADDVTYRPGEGVGGRKVAPADLPGSGANAIPNLVPDVLEIPIDIMPLKGKAYATHGLDQTTSQLGIVRYDMLKGTFTFNGEPIGGEDQAALAEACAKRGVR
ncbi:hypothetical protein [Magnetospirillum sp. 64-120]|uniref:hypothetical protein n=1 Tax=Magnetospirillum sp. 64-120 TaxID=1895778 RepID=UPI00092B9B70|nr:hypothetical protein [Magnetospirillum sp. 64-120]OJX81147.1 MAG: hypothetical protein BGO92_08770 [Magnetospirillum sp. 64-120]